MKTRYVYKKGKAIVFGGGFMHATEPGKGPVCYIYRYYTGIDPFFD